MPIVALEFFSGIGGLHYGLQHACPDAKVVASFDTNTIANKVYAHNFGLEPTVKGIERLDTGFLDKFQANCWLLSPPCQPYTAGGNRLDHEDNRAQGLLNLIKLLPHLKCIPDYIFVENVPNFELSESRRMLVETLYELDFEMDEFLVSPIVLGVPNNRRRYYLAAKRGKKMSEIPSLNDIHTDFSRFSGQEPMDLTPLHAYLENLTNFDEYLVKPDDIRKRTNFKFDVVHPSSSMCSTFTKAYGSHHFFGSGSFLQTDCLDTPFDAIDNELLISVKPRFFTPTEIARLHYFPIDDGNFSFPKGVTVKQQWKLLGNSLNCLVVGTILKRLLAQ
jgi:tRNA (cytosine38-C5)-methyltransferase